MKNNFINKKDALQVGPCSYNINNKKTKKGGFIGTDGLKKRV